MTKQQTTQNLDTFLSAYLETAVWSSSDDDGNSLDNDYDVDAFTQKAVAEAKKDCKAFLDAYGDLMFQASPDFAQHGHDFWLTRNGHGAGFWDRGYGALGDELSKAAKVYGSCDIYVNRKRLHFT